ncbi:DUF2330 domain-containing protein [Streptomyces sp. NPDC058739]|uniref:DUF2330 domain-containing protein n=1 Tax=Streptomyces sp. NPDC058739 TaxID=3346618 RepID=UPI0036954B74
MAGFRFDFLFEWVRAGAGVTARARGRGRAVGEPLGPGRLRLRLLTVVLALLGVQLAGQLVAPAYACGCGAMVPDERQRVRVDREESVVRWDGRQEQIVMSLTVGGDARRAAWIMPVPHRATVRLGDPGLFEELAAATAPGHRDRYYFWPRDGDWPLDSDDDGLAGAPPPGAGPGVSVVGRQRLGPFDVARLTATDPAALAGWLRANGFTFPGHLRQALRPYVEQRWEYVAVKLAPDTGDAVLTGRLDPIHLTFAAEEPVYPMRLSQLADTPQSLGLYVLADHRMEPRSRIGGQPPRVTFAGPVEAAASGALARLTRGTPYLTALAQEFPEPARISGDHELARAATDGTFRQVVYEDRLRTVAGVPAWLLTVGGVLVLLAAGAVFVLRPGRRRASARTSGAAETPTA